MNKFDTDFWKKANSINSEMQTPDWIDPEIAYHDENGWKHAIEYIANCGHPTIYICSHGSLQIQQTINLYLSSSFLAQELGHTYQNPEFKFNDNICLIPFNSLYQYKTKKSKEIFNYNYSALIDENSGLRDIVKYGVTEANNMVITNLQDFDTNLKKYNKVKEDYAEYNNFAYVCNDDSHKGWIWIEKILDKIFSLYPNEIKFNIVISDTDFISISKRAKIGTCLDILTKLIKKVDKFYTVSEGWSTFLQFENLKNWWKFHGYVPYSKKLKIWSTIKSLPFEKARQIVAITDVWQQFINCEKFVKVFSPGNKALTSSHYINNNIQMTKDTIIKPCYPWFNIWSYKKLFKTNNMNLYYNKFIKAFFNFYHFDIDNENQRFEDCIIDNEIIQNNFDQNKKNIIFLLPSFMGRLPTNECITVLTEYKKIIDKIVINYPLNKWNYIYKFHPRASNKYVYESLKIIFNNKIPNNSVILKHTYPFEYLITLDNYLVETSKEKFYHLIDPTTFKQNKPSGVITGEDLVSTSVYTTMEIFANELNYNWNDVINIIQLDAYYLPKNYLMGTTILKDSSIENKAKFYYLFNMFFEVDQFPNPKNFKIID